MKIVCAPSDHPILREPGTQCRVAIYSRDGAHADVTAGAALLEEARQRLHSDARAWDLLSIALAVTAADKFAIRDRSPDGWTREFDLTIAVADPAFWRSCANLLATQLQFLSTDRWTLQFVENGTRPPEPRRVSPAPENAVILLSGGMDSFIGALDTDGHRLLAVSQVSHGDGARQRQFAGLVGGGLRHLQLNHNARPSPELSDRTRSFIFLTYGVLAASSLDTYRAGNVVPLFVCENGFISLNPPLTASRFGSLSTRTTHPEFLRSFGSLLSAAGLRIELRTPYRFATKGEMLVNCAEQELLRKFARTTTSCGRFGHYGMRHCGRCVPCLIRRAAFLRRGGGDRSYRVRLSESGSA